jgi:hypothetical protein
MVKNALSQTEATFRRQIGRSPRRCESPPAAAKGNVDRATDPKALVDLLDLEKPFSILPQEIGDRSLAFENHASVAARDREVRQVPMKRRRRSHRKRNWQRLASHRTSATVVRSGSRYSGIAALSRIERIKAVGPDVIAPAGFLVRITQSLHLDFDIENLESSRCRVSLSLWPISTSKPSVVDRQTASSLGFCTALVTPYLRP